MVRRIYLEESRPFDTEGKKLMGEIAANLRISSLEGLRILTRLDVESEASLPLGKIFSDAEMHASPYADLLGCRVFAAELMDEEAPVLQWAANRIRLESEAPFTLRAAKVYALSGSLNEEELLAVKEYILRSEGVEEESLSLPATLKFSPSPIGESETVCGFRDLDMGGLESLAHRLGLDMGASQLAIVQEHFKAEYRDPTDAELYIFDALSSCGRLTMGAAIEVEAPCPLHADAVRAIRSAQGDAGAEGELSLAALTKLPLLLKQKRADAETCMLGGAPAVRVNLGGDAPDAVRYLRLSAHEGGKTPLAALYLTPSCPPSEGDAGEARARRLLPEKISSRLAAEGVAAFAAETCGGDASAHSYAFETYLSEADEEDGEKAACGDRLILLGEETFHALNAASPLRCCCTLAEGGIARAVSCIADGADLELEKMPLKRGESLRAILEGKRGAILAVGAREAEELLGEACKFGPAALIGTVTEVPRLIIRQGGKAIVNLSIETLERGAGGHVRLELQPPEEMKKPIPLDFATGMRLLAKKTDVFSRKALSDLFHFAAGGGTASAPFGGKYSLTPSDAAAVRIFGGKNISYLTWGGNGELAKKSPYHAAYYAVIESISRLIAAGADLREISLLLQGVFPDGEGVEVFEKQFGALLGACKAQLDLGVASLGSEIGSTREKVSPALYCMAMATGMEREIVSPAFKAAGHKVVLLSPERDENGLPIPHSFIKNCKIVTALQRADKVRAAYAVSGGGVAEGVLKCCLGNEIGFRFSDMVPMETVFGYNYGCFILELNDETAVGEELGRTTLSETLSRGLDLVPLTTLKEIGEAKCSPVFGRLLPQGDGAEENFTSFKKCSAASPVCIERPRVLLPVFCGGRGPVETVRAFEAAGAEVELFPVPTLDAKELSCSAERLAGRLSQTQILFLPDEIGGYHVRDHARFIAKYLRRGAIADAIGELLERGGLIGGLGLGMEVLSRLGLLPLGKMCAEGERAPLTLADAGYTVSRILRVRVVSNASPWLSGVLPGDIFSAPVYGGRRLTADPDLLRELAERGQVATQFVDPEGNATADPRFEPIGCTLAVEGIVSPDGRIFGRLANSALSGRGLYKNVPGEYDMKIFASAVKYFK